MQISLGKSSPAASAVHVHLHAYRGTSVLVEGVVGVGHHITFQGCTSITLGHLDGIELIHIGTGTFANTFHAPLQTQVGRQYFLSLGSLEQFADGIHIALGGISYHTSVSALYQLQTTQEGMLLAQLLNLCGRENLVGLLLTVAAHHSCQVILGCLSGISIGLSHLCGISCDFSLSVLHSGISLGLLCIFHGCQFSVQSIQEGDNLIGIVGLPELQVGTSLQELTYTLGLLHARHLHHDTSFLSFESLDVGLYHTEAVNTGTKHVVGVVDGTFYLCAEYALHLLVVALGGHLVTQLLCGKDFCQRLPWCQGLVVLHKQGNEITLAVGSLFCCLLYGTAEVFVAHLLVVGQSHDDIRHAYLQDDIHTSLEVQAQTNTHLAALLECPHVAVHLVIEY